MGLIDDNCKALAAALHLFEDYREFLQSGDDKALAVIEGISQVSGVLLLVDYNDASDCMIEAGNRLLELGIEHSAICHDNDRIEKGLVFFKQ